MNRPKNESRGITSHKSREMFQEYVGRACTLRHGAVGTPKKSPLTEKQKHTTENESDF